ncbi:hypothetical protein AGMMS50289_04000 [Betaproteobacteria bacterium]|nr:hypothetical protein AGMMS50289_04000 [Betaproteobacteria bacterium]
MNIDTLSQFIQQHTQGKTWFPQGMSVYVSKMKEERNPRSVTVSLRGDDVIGGIRVNVELYETDAKTLLDVRATVKPVRLGKGVAAGEQTAITTADIQEIYADKIFALGARPFLKARDVFDVHWLKTVHSEQCKCTYPDLRSRLRLYPGDTAAEWLNKARMRRDELLVSQDAIQKNLVRWLPAWEITLPMVEEFTISAIAALDEGIDLMSGIVAEEAPPENNKKGIEP